MKEYNNEMSFIQRVVYSMIRNGGDNVFLPYGMTINGTNIVLYGNDDFPLKGETCAYYDVQNNSININIEDEFFNKDKEQKIFFILFHEITHRFLCHNERRQDKNQLIYNMQQDYEIHNLLYVYKETISQSADIGYTEFKNFFNSIEQFLFTKDTHFCFNEEYLPLTAEEIYFKLLKKYEKNLITVSNFTTEINGQEVDVSISTDKNGKKSVEVNFKNNNQNGENESKEKRNAKISSDMNKQIIMDALNKEANKSKGDFSNKVSIFLKKFIHVKVDWERILRDSLLTELTKGDEYSWQSLRPSMFQNGIALPNLSEDYQKYGTLIIQRDESGSMNNDSLEKCAKIIKDQSEYFTKIIIIKHDTKISSVETFDTFGEELINSALTRISNGGTSHKQVFEYISDYVKNNDEKISQFIGFTDLCSDIQDTQSIMPKNIPIFWICENSFIDYEKLKNGINGKIINIE